MKPETKTKRNKMNTSIETHNGHSVTDYIRDCYLKPECVNVRLSRVESGIYEVVIDPQDRDYTFESDVAEAVAEVVGGRALTHGCGNGIMVSAPKGFRAHRGFVKVENL